MEYKYLKYKHKYNLLKNQLMGGDLNEDDYINKTINERVFINNQYVDSKYNIPKLIVDRLKYDGSLCVFLKTAYPKFFDKNSSYYEDIKIIDEWNLKSSPTFIKSLKKDFIIRLPLDYEDEEDHKYYPTIKIGEVVHESPDLIIVEGKFGREYI